MLTECYYNIIELSQLKQSLFPDIGRNNKHIEKDMESIYKLVISTEYNNNNRFSTYRLRWQQSMVKEQTEIEDNDRLAYYYQNQ